MVKQPTKEEIIEKLEKITTNESTREKVSNWAMGFIEDDDLEIYDFNVWELLITAGGIDVIKSPNEYLYSHRDIRKWIEDALNQGQLMD